MKHVNILLFFLFIATICVYSQVDSSYIKPYKENFAINTYLGRDFVFLAQDTPDESKTFLPNNPVNVGLGFSINNTVLSFSYGYGFDFFRDKKLGKTKSFDFQFHNYSRKFVFDIILQKYEGFYRDLEQTKQEVILAPDLKIRQYAAYGQYVFNHKKYSYQAAFVQNEKQLISTGSLLLGTGIYSTRIDSETSFLHEGKHTLDNFQFGISGGYAYTWVISSKWYIAGSLTVGINFGSETARDFGKQRIEVYPSTFPRIAAGYSVKDWSLGFSYISNIIFPAITDDNTVTILSGTGQFSFRKRFDTIPFFSQRQK